MMSLFGIVLALLVGINALGQSEAEREFVWTIKVKIPPSLGVKYQDLHFTDSLKIFHHEQVIASANFVKNEPLKFTLSGKSILPRSVRLEARCWTRPHGCSLGYYHIEWNGILPAAGEAHIVAKLVSDNI